MIRTTTLAVMALLLAGCSGEVTDTDWGTVDDLNSGGAEQTTTTGQTSTAAQTTTSAASTPKGTSVQIVSKSTYRDSIGYLHIVGEVINNGPQNSEYTKISATFYKADGSVFGTDFTFAQRSILPAGEKSPFDVTKNDDNAEIADYKLTVSSTATNKAPIGAGLFVTQGTNSNTDSIGYYHVVGEVQNNAAKEGTYVKVIATIYNAAGTVIGSEFTFTDPTNVPAGQSAGFDVTHNIGAGSPASYALYVDVSALR